MTRNGWSRRDTRPRNLDLSVAVKVPDPVLGFLFMTAILKVAERKPGIRTQLTATPRSRDRDRRQQGKKLQPPNTSLDPFHLWLWNSTSRRPCLMFLMLGGGRIPLPKDAILCSAARQERRLNVSLTSGEGKRGRKGRTGDRQAMKRSDHRPFLIFPSISTRLEGDIGTQYFLSFSFIFYGSESWFRRELEIGGPFLPFPDRPPIPYPTLYDPQKMKKEKERDRGYGFHGWSLLGALLKENIKDSIGAPS